MGETLSYNKKKIRINNWHCQRLHNASDAAYECVYNVSVEH